MTTYTIEHLTEAHLEVLHDALKTYNNMYIGDGVAKDMQQEFFNVLKPDEANKNYRMRGYQGPILITTKNQTNDH
jgi:hypothetical protein